MSAEGFTFYPMRKYMESKSITWNCIMASEIYFGKRF